MAKSSGRSFSRRASGRRGSVTVIEDHVSRSYTRNAKIAFWVVSVVAGLLAATVLADKWHPIVALLLGGVLGVAVALPIAAVIAIWPVLRVIVWWLPEILIATDCVLGFVVLAQHTTLAVRLVVVVVLAVPFAFPQVRRHVMKVAWCLVSRHRLRTCFAEFIIGNNRASLPFVLWARPTLVGESVWLWLRPGLAMSDLEGRLEQIAAACWADKVTVERASQSNSAYVRMDISRRDALTGTVVSPLTEEISGADDALIQRATLVLDTPADGLDLDDVTEAFVLDAQKNTVKNGRADNGKKPGPNREPVTVPAAHGVDDISDYID
ncbi:TMEM198/TM7SF3 family protein [Sphaerisporangium perillae]|uniref:TMEM198/TM7SF3 family protein n=1 Tax=Sphaerisporangium perillae TaxID=2935860 RepID=UPI00200BC635|nr:TMEM198/TM7SF3 family protein [Sphaerisporangium perillae]